MSALALLAALAVGYGLGRWQPWRRLGDWTNWQLRFHLDRWESRPCQAVLFALLLTTDPTRTVRAWRRRNDPAATRSPAMTFTPRDPA